MRLPRTGDFYFTLGILLFLLLLVGMAFTYESKAALVPLVIGIPTVLLVCLELARHQSRTLSRLLDATYFSVKKPAGQDEEEASPKPRGQEMSAILIMMGYVALVMVVGFHLAIPVFVFFYCLAFARSSWWQALLLAAATWGFIYLVFCIALGVKFPWGFIF